jgi:predicted ABC-type transport system involved in lysophospholipase L1 biosynthesis ATPase subunit
MGHPDGAVLELQGVWKRYRQGEQEQVALADVSLTVAPGELVAVVGPSGSGKSTLLHVAAGLDEPDAGSVLIHGAAIGAMGAGARARLRRSTLGFVFQFFQLLPSLTVAENVELPLLLDSVRNARAAAGDALSSVGLGAKHGRYPAELSGGEMQRVAIARALVARPPLILADEPTGNLDSATGSAVLDVLTEQVRARGAAMVLVTHDPSAAGRADRILSVLDGRLQPS